MSKRKKNKKDLDFQKVKLKVGRKLKRDSNETKAEFKSRKIILKEVRSYSDDPLGALARHSENISQHGKLSMLNHFNSALTADIVKSLNKPILDSLSKFIVDHSDQVRAAAIKCLKTCYNHSKQQHLSTRDFMQSLRPYLDCAYTHVSASIAADCHKFLDYFVNMNDSQIFEPIMKVILRRYEVGNLTATEKNLAVKLRRFYIRNRQKQNVDQMLQSDHLESSVWSKANYSIDLDRHIYHLGDSSYNPDREIYLGRIERKEDIVDRYLETVDDQEMESPMKNNSRPNPSREIRRIF